MAELWLGAEVVFENTFLRVLEPNVPNGTFGCTEKPVPVEHWYAVSVRPRHEKVVTNHLQKQGLNYFLPIYRSIRRWKDRRKELDMVLFPGYVFVHIDLKHRLRVLQLPSVIRFVSFNGHPAPLPEHDIDALRNGLVSGIHAAPHPYLKI